MTRTLPRLLAAAVLSLSASAAVAGESGIDFDLTVHGGVDKYDSVGLKSGLSSARFTDAQQLKDMSQSYGVTGIFRIGALSAGALAELGRPGRANPTAAIAALGGLNLVLGPLQIDALGELGGHRYGDALHNPAVIVDTNRSDWLAYVGLRPGVSLRLGEHRDVIFGVWAFARWDLMKKDVAVTLADLSGTGHYDLGGTQLGAALRFGLSF